MIVASVRSEVRGKRSEVKIKIASPVTKVFTSDLLLLTSDLLPRLQCNAAQRTRTHGHEQSRSEAERNRSAKAAEKVRRLSGPDPSATRRRLSHHVHLAPPRRPRDPPQTPAEDLLPDLGRRPRSHRSRRRFRA